MDKKRDNLQWSKKMGISNSCPEAVLIRKNSIYLVWKKRILYEFMWEMKL